MRDRPIASAARRGGPLRPAAGLFALGLMLAQGLAPAWAAAPRQAAPPPPNPKREAAPPAASHTPASPTPASVAVPAAPIAAKTDVSALDFPAPAVGLHVPPPNPKGESGATPAEASAALPEPQTEDDAALVAAAKALARLQVKPGAHLDFPPLDAAAPAPPPRRMTAAPARAETEIGTGTGAETSRQAVLTPAFDHPYAPLVAATPRAEGPRPPPARPKRIPARPKPTLATLHPNEKLSPQGPGRLSPGSAPRAATGRDGQLQDDELVLLGVFGTRAKPQALVRLPSGQVKTVRPGQQAEGWTFTRITLDRGVSAKSGSRAVTLQMPGG